MHALIDADIVTYRAAAAAEKEDLNIARYYVDKTMNNILSSVWADTFKAYLSGGGNFRFNFFPHYKANRAKSQRPRWLQELKTYMVLKYEAKVCDGIEADDQIAIDFCTYTQSYPNIHVLCSIDKDFHQLFGLHFNWVKPETRVVLVGEAMDNFYKQLILGDRADGIPGYDGMARQKPTKFLEKVFSETLDLERVMDLYKDHAGLDALLVTGNLCYLQRKENDFWAPLELLESIGIAELQHDREALYEYMLKTVVGNDQYTELGLSERMESGTSVTGVKTDTTLEVDTQQA